MNPLLEAFAANITLFAIFLFFTKAFWVAIGYEKTLREDHFQKVLDLNNRFTKIEIDPRIERLYYDIYKAGFGKGVDFVKQLLYEPISTNGEAVLFSNDKINESFENFKDTLAAQNSKMQDASRQYLFTNEAMSFFSVLEKLYEKKHVINMLYNRMITFCRLLSAGTLTICVLMLLGIFLHVIKVDQWLEISWLVISILVMCTTLVFLAITLRAKNKLSDEWEFNKINNGE